MSMNELTLFDQIEKSINESIDADDPYIALGHMKRLLEAQQLIGKGLAKFLYLMHSHWESFSLSKQEGFNDVITQSLNLAPYTRDRYLKFGQYESSLPEEIKEKPIRELIPITNALSQGYDFSDDNWKDIERASNLAEVEKVVREDIRGEEPRKSSLQIYVDQQGSIVAWYNQERFSVGYLDMSNETEAIQKAVTRIINRSGIIER